MTLLQQQLYLFLHIITIYKDQVEPLYIVAQIQFILTSTLHNWNMNSNTFSGYAQFGFSNSVPATLSSINSLIFSLVVSTLKSDDKKLDRNAYKALKTDQFKNITYKLSSSTVMPGKENRYLVKTKGNLNIAGISKQVSMDVYCVVNNDATVTCTGSKQLKMTDYEIKPPTFMLGAMKTGDDITLDFTMVCNK